jgi:hypothetical protein
MNLKEKAKTLNELLWEKQIELAPKYKEKWVRLEDAEQTLKKLLNIISECCACDIQLLNRKLEELLKEVPLRKLGDESQ